MWALLKRALFPWRADRSKERRRERRHLVTYQAKLTLQGEAVTVVLEDATVGGTRLRSQRKLTVGQVVLVTFPSGDREAVCRWSRQDGPDWVSGLQFARNINNEESARI